ncbi:MAG TPA: diaminopimelate decarboxylase [Desulfohalobiaceae bacterium]|nr:diaminopimelate decarboxylase [Desulfohalobiaceae bacterium]
MHHFHYQDGELWAEDVKVTDLAERYETPLYVYSAATLKRHFQAFDSAFNRPHLCCFSVKSNSNLSILKLLGQFGAGMDIVSGGELHRALTAGIDPHKIVFSGVGKQKHEIQAALMADILIFNIESVQELYQLSEQAQFLGKTARISLRINPDIDPQTHPYISTGLEQNKFGIDISQALETYRLAQQLPGIDPIGIDCHIGSQLTKISPFLDALERLKDLYNQLSEQDIHIKYLDLGGGLGIPYSEETPPHPVELGQALTKSLQGYDLTLILEPGRVISGNAGILVTRVLFFKQSKTKNFVVIDAAMNDLIRPSLYNAYHRVDEVVPQGRDEQSVDIVGPICETGDFLAQDRLIPQVSPGELLAVYTAGAYGFTMSSQYNSRPRAAEVLIDGDQSYLIRRREIYQDLMALEKPYLDGEGGTM